MQQKAPDYPYRPRRKKNQTKMRTGIGTPKSHSKPPDNTILSLVPLQQPSGANNRSQERQVRRAAQSCLINPSRSLSNEPSP